MKTEKLQMSAISRLRDLIVMRTHQNLLAAHMRPTMLPFSARSLRVYLSLLIVCLLVLQPLAPIIASATSSVRAARNLSQPQTATPIEAAATRHAPVINGRVEGSLRQLTGENVTLSSNAVITGDLLVPGTPTVRLHGAPSFGGTITGTGSAQPSGYFVTLDNGATLGRLITRTDAVSLADVAAPPPSQGTRSVTLISPGQSAGDFTTLRDLTLSGSVGMVNVPPGTYRNFTANSGNGFTLGVASATQPAVYNLSRLTLSSGSQLRIIGPVALTLGNALVLNSGATVGSTSHPLWLTIKVANGGVTLNNGSSLYGAVRAPYGTVGLNNAPLRGSVHSDRLIVNSGLLVGVPPEPATLEGIAPTRATQGQTLSVTLTGRNTHWTSGQTRAAFGGEVSVGGAASGALGPLTVLNETTAVADLVIAPTAALAPRIVRVVTPLSGGGTESVDLADSFKVVAIAPPGSSSTNVTTIAGSSGLAGFADGPAAQARFRELAGIASGPDDSIYVADAGNHRIRIVRQQSDAWTVQTLAGDGTVGYRDGAGAQARFNNPQGVAVDASGAVYVADTGNQRIRRIATDGTVTTIAGDGTAGFLNGAGAQARFNGPRGIATDNLGNIYVADTSNAAVRVINAGGEVRTVAGDGTVGASDSPNARFNGLAGLAVDGTSIFIYLADTGNHRIRRLDAGGTVITLTGAERGFRDGAGAQARFAEPSGIAIDGAGKIIVADTINSLVRMVDPDLLASGALQAVGTFAGTGERGSTDGTGNQARFSMPRGVAITRSSAIIVADTGNHTLRRITLPPVITALTPSSARPLATVTITGERFDGRAPERNTVRFTRAASAGGGQTAAQVTAASRRQLTVVVPADVATGPVIVQTEGGTAISPSDFVLAPEPDVPPVINDFNPKRGPVGTVVTITGTALRASRGETTVTFAGRHGARLPALVSFSSPTEVRAAVPNGAHTGLIELTTIAGSAPTRLAFTVEGQQDFSITVSPSAATAVERSTATYIVSLNSQSPSFTQLARLSTTGLPAGVRTTFDPAQITSGARSTLRVHLAEVALAPGSYPFNIRAAANIEGSERVRTAAATLNVLAGGQTTLSGRVLSTESEPVIGATVSLDGRTATTDAAGSFLLSGVTAGSNRPLMVDGRTASAPNRSYPVILEPATIIAGQPNVVPYTFYLPPIDVQHEVEVIPNQNTVATNPRVPGLQMTVLAGANLRNRDGSPVTRVSITPLPIDRTPAPLPANVATGLVYTSQPGGAIADLAMPVIYPNSMGADPGARVDLYAFNHDTVEWYVYGYGRVSTDGRTIAPEINPATGRSYGLTDFSWHFPNAAADGDPGGGPGGGGGGSGEGGGGGTGGCPDSSRGSRPVDHATGMKIETATDIAFGGARGGLNLSRTYTSDLGRAGVSGRFGRGTKDNYDVRLVGNFVVDGAGRMIGPEEQTGRLFSYAGHDLSGNLYFKSSTIFQLLGDAVRRLLDGTLEFRTADGGFMRFNSVGRLVSLSDRNGNTTNLHYSGTNLTQITDAVGRSITLAYNSSDQIVSATDPLGRVWRYAYDSSGRLEIVTDPLGQVARYAYNFFHELTSITDPRGNIVKQITYNGSGRVISQRFSDGGVENYAYTLSGAVVTNTTITDALGRNLTKRFNANGYVVESTDALGQKMHIERAFNNLPVATTGSCGCAEESRQYDERGNVTAITDRLGQTARIEYEPNFNNVTRVTDKLNRVSTLAYDGYGNLTTITDALNQRTTTDFDLYGRMTSVADPTGRTTRLEYDAHGHLSARVDTLGHRWTMEYDAIGRMTASIDPLGRRTTMTYDALDRLLTTTDASGAVTRFTYDANGNRTKVTDHLNREWRTVYDALNRPVLETDPLGRVTRRTYNLEGELIILTSPSGRLTRYTYDSRGQVATITDPLNGVVSFAYDTKGNLTSVTDQRGHTTTYVYDELFRQVESRNPLGQATTVAYDAMNRVTETIDRLGRRTAFTYDALDRLTSATYADAQVSYTYDVRDRITRIGDTQGGAINWSYDAEGRVLSETSPSGAVSYTYNAAGQRTAMTVADRPSVTYGYDSAGRLQTISQGTETFTYSYDPLSRITSLARPNGVTSSYSYDAVGRLDRLQHINHLSQAIEDYRYTYTPDDWIASITSLRSATLLTAPRTASPADAANRIAQFGQATYVFDDRGQTSSKSDAQGTTQYTWDARGRLTQAATPGGQVVSYSYDALGRRATRAASGLTTSFLYDGQDVVLDRGSDSSTIDYLNGIKIDDKLRQTSATTGALYFLQDHLGSTQALVNASGSVVELQQYEAFGASSGSSLTRYGYTGRERDAATGLLHYRARWYDPQQGRFISEDPADMAAGLNFYTYAGNNPLHRRDPLGLDWQDEVLGYAAHVAAGFGDTLSFGLTRKVRQWQGTDHVINRCTGAYQAGEWAGTAHGLLSGGAGVAKVVGKVLTRRAARKLAQEAAEGADDIVVLGRGSLQRLQRLAQQEGGRISTIDSNVAKEIFKQNYRDIRKADKIVQYMDNIPDTLDEALRIGGGQFSRAEVYMINQRKDLFLKTTRIFENLPVQ